MTQGIVVLRGMDSLGIKKIRLDRNVITSSSTLTPLFDTFQIEYAEDALLTNNFVDMGAAYNGRSIFRLQNCSNVTATTNRLVNSPRGFSVAASDNLTIAQNTGDNQGVAFVEVTGTSSDIKVLENQIYGACHQNNGAPVVYASDGSRLQLHRNLFVQAARMTSTNNFGTGVATTAFGKAAGKALDTVSSSNKVINDGSHSMAFYSTAGEAMAAGYLSEVPGGAMRGTSSQKPSSPTPGSLYYDTTNSRLQAYIGSAWLTVAEGAGTQPLDTTLTALAGLDSSTGMVVETASDTFTKRSLVGTANQVIVSNGNGVAGNPTFSLPQDIASTSSPTFANPVFSSALFGPNVKIKRDGTGSDERLQLETYNGIAGYSLWLREKTGDANLTVQADASAKAANLLLNSTATSFNAMRGLVSGTLKWAIGRVGHSSGVHVYTLDGLTRAATFDDSQNTTLYGTLSMGGKQVLLGGGGSSLFDDGNTHLSSNGNNIWFDGGAGNIYMNAGGSGKVAIGHSDPTAQLDLSGDGVRVRTARTPASATALGNQGDICWDSDYVYVCIATNTWKRAALAMW